VAVKGVILAAGRGVRMGGVEHKSLIPVGNSKPLLYYLLADLKAAGVTDLLVVTGHRPQDVQAAVTDNWDGNEPTFVRNARYASWGNFHSLRMAIDQAPGDDLLVLNCDIVVHPTVLERALSTGGQLVLAVERRYRLDEEDMRVELNGDRVQYIGKDLPLRRSHGEFCGVSLLRRDAGLVYADLATRAEWLAETHIYYEDIYQQMVETVDVRASLVREGEYAEVDLPEEMTAAERVITRHAEVWRTAEPAAEPA
jgi:choline kinase